MIVKIKTNGEWFTSENIKKEVLLDWFCTLAKVDWMHINLSDGTKLFLCKDAIQSATFIAQE